MVKCNRFWVNDEISLDENKLLLRYDSAPGSRAHVGTQGPHPGSPLLPLLPPPTLTTQRSRRLVSLAVRTVMLVGATSGGACSVWMTRDDGLKGLVPTTFTCLIRNLEAKPMGRVMLQQK